MNSVGYHTNRSKPVLIIRSHHYQNINVYLSFQRNEYEIAVARFGELTKPFASKIRTRMTQRKRTEQDADRRPPAPEHLDDVAHGRAGPRGDDTDRTRKGRQAGLPLRIEEPLGSQAQLQRLVGRLQLPSPSGSSRSTISWYRPLRA